MSATALPVKRSKRSVETVPPVAVTIEQQLAALQAQLQLQQKQAQTIHQDEQKQASERDSLLVEINNMCGAGLSSNRFQFAIRLHTYCFTGTINGSKTRFSNLIADADKSVSPRGVYECVQLADLSKKCPLLAKLDWSAVKLFSRAIKFNWDENKTVYREIEKINALLARIVAGACMGKKGGYDLKAIKQELDMIIPPRKSNADSFLVRVAKWLNSAEGDDVMEVVSLLSDDKKLELMDAIGE